MVADIAFSDILEMPEECPIMPDAGHFSELLEILVFCLEHDYGIPGRTGLVVY